MKVTFCSIEYAQRRPNRKAVPPREFLVPGQNFDCGSDKRTDGQTSKLTEQNNARDWGGLDLVAQGGGDREIREHQRQQQKHQQQRNWRAIISFFSLPRMDAVRLSRLRNPGGGVRPRRSRGKLDDGAWAVDLNTKPPLLALDKRSRPSRNLARLAVGDRWWTALFERLP